MPRYPAIEPLGIPKKEKKIFYMEMSLPVLLVLFRTLTEACTSKMTVKVKHNYRNNTIYLLSAIGIIEFSEIL